MILSLPWKDLVVEAAPEAEARSWLEPWAELLCHGAFRVLFLNRFGCAFLERPDGRVEMLDVFYGQLEPLAASGAEFAEMVGDPAWREVYLLADYVVRLHAAGKVAGDEEALRTRRRRRSPAGPIPGPTGCGAESAMVLPVAALQRLYADHVNKAAEPPSSR